MTHRFQFIGHPISKDNFKSFNRFGRPFLSQKFKAYENGLRVQFLAQKPADWKILEGKLKVGVSYYFSNGRRSDLLNLPKSLDFGNKLIWGDDKQIIQASLEVLEGVDEGFTLSVEEVAK